MRKTDDIDKSLKHDPSQYRYDDQEYDRRGERIPWSPPVVHFNPELMRVIGDACRFNR